MRIGLLLWLPLIFSVSAFADEATIPNLIGLSEAEARELLEGEGVSGTIHVEHTFGDEYKKECTSEVDAGLVCAQSPAADTEQLAELPVKFLVQKDRSSKPISGSILHRIPGIGLSEVDARDRISAAGFIGVVKLIEATSDAGCENELTRVGHVCGVTIKGKSIRGGDKVPANAPIALHVRTARAAGDRYGLVPNVKGLQVDAAIQALQDGGFPAYTIRIVDQSGCAPLTVCSQPNEDDGPQNRHNRNAEIQLKLGTAHPGKNRGEPFLMTNLVGKDFTTVLRLLDAQGVKSLEVDRVMIIGGKLDLIAGDSWSYCTKEKDVADLEPGQVCAQRPSDGATVHGGRSRIVLYEGRRRLTEGR